MASKLEEGASSLDLEQNNLASDSPRSSIDSLLSLISVDEEKVKQDGVSTSQWPNRFLQAHSGVFLMLLAQVFSTLMNVAVRMLESSTSHMQPQQILFFRMSITTAAITFYLWRQKDTDSLLGRKENRRLLHVRGIGGFLGVFGLYYSLQYLDIGEAIAITFLTPMVTSIMCSIAMKTPVSRGDLITGAVSLLGVIFIAKPFSMGSVAVTLMNSDESLEPNLISPVFSTPTQRIIGLLIAIAGVLGSAAAFTSMRWMAKPQSPLVAVNYFTACCTAITFAWSLISQLTGGTGFHAPETVTEWALLGTSGACGFIMQVLITLALQRPDSSTATNVVYSQIIFALVADYFIFGSALGLLSLLGTVLILASVVYELFV